MHVCFLCDEYPSGTHGGVGSFTQTLARSLVASGHSVSVTGIYPGLREATLENDRGVQVTRLPHSRVPNTGLAVNALTLRRALASIHREHPIDVLEGQESAFARLPARFPVARVIRMHGGHHFFTTTLGDRPRFPRAWLERRSFRHADYLCAVSRFVAETTRQLLRLGDVDIEILPNPVDTSTFYPRGAELESPDSILFVGSLCEKKGIRQLIQAMPAIVASVPNAYLHVVGPDRSDPRTGRSFRAQLEELMPASLNERIVFRGAVANRVLPDVLATAAVAVYPSHMEACPVAWLEGMAMGKAIVASKTGPGPEILDDGVSGLLCDPHDPQSIADRVIALLKDAGLRNRLASAAHRRATEQFSIEAVVQRNAAFYQGCIERHRVAPGSKPFVAQPFPPPLAHGSSELRRGSPKRQRREGGRAANAGLKPCATDLTPCATVSKPFLGLRTLLVVTHVAHYEYDGRLFAYAPYARELGVWSEIFPKLLIAAPCRESRPPADCEEIAAANIELRPQREAGGTSLGAKLALAVSLPSLGLALVRAIREADAVHVRCPGNLGLLGAVLAPRFSKYVIAKYAGQWSAYAGEPLTSRLQRWLLRSAWWGGPVLVYGELPGQPAHVIPFFTSALTTLQVQRARVSAASRRRGDGPLRVLYVGRLSTAKNVHVLVDAMAALKAGGDQADCVIVGEGPERSALEQRIDRNGVSTSVRLAGGMSLNGVLDYYERADVLVLASETEGWPKAIAEAMAFGVVCVGSDRGLVPWMLGDGRGIVVPPGDVAPLAAALKDICRRPGEYDQMRDRAAAWGQQHSLDSFKDALAHVLTTRWGAGSATIEPVVSPSSS